MRWERDVVLAITLLIAAGSSRALASEVSAPPSQLRLAIAHDMRDTVDRAMGYKRPEGATYANSRGEIVSPHGAIGSGVPRVHFTLLGSELIARSINRRLRGMFGQHDPITTSVLTPTHQR